jgi:hypothetical protein
MPKPTATPVKLSTDPYMDALRSVPAIEQVLIARAAVRKRRAELDNAPGVAQFVSNMASHLLEHEGKFPSTFRQNAHAATMAPELDKAERDALDRLGEDLDRRLKNVINGHEADALAFLQDQLNEVLHQVGRATDVPDPALIKAYQAIRRAHHQISNPQDLPDSRYRLSIAGWAEGIQDAYPSWFNYRPQTVGLAAHGDGVASHGQKGINTEAPPWTAELPNIMKSGPGGTIRPIGWHEVAPVDPAMSTAPGSEPTVWAALRWMSQERDIVKPWVPTRAQCDAAYKAMPRK